MSRAKEGSNVVALTPKRALAVLPELSAIAEQSKAPHDGGRAGWSDLSEAYCKVRAERDWSQADLADRLDVSRQTVNAIETEKYDPSLPLAFKLARLFGQPIESLFEDPGGPGQRKR